MRFVELQHGNKRIFELFIIISYTSIYKIYVVKFIVSLA